MKVILLDEDKIADVADGHARNYLFPKKKAIPATPAAVAQMEKRAEKNRVQREAELNQAQELADKIEGQELLIAADASEEGKLFGSITSTEVAQAIKDKLGLEIEKKKINLNDHIKTVGEYSATVKIHAKINAHLKLVINKK